MYIYKIITHSTKISVLSLNLSNIVKNILEDRYNGFFFIKYGVFDWDIYSNTLLLEQELE